ncbi:hypothetical protein PY257_15165 [Ramlibacter sp. H39-3-26]|uniref:hypothetical protein n=1 Tax=Curvibacter soli TaxID=3031331 RepID=UPI0023DAE940|nr:hypothetical protein [Ramlibacter sp. H39-3-26]MDF1486503.1 hypothetical protein [Ramlibacter sp. H39-3-26]
MRSTTITAPHAPPARPAAGQPWWRALLPRRAPAPQRQQPAQRPQQQAAASDPLDLAQRVREVGEW